VSESTLLRFHRTLLLYIIGKRKALTLFSLVGDKGRRTKDEGRRSKVEGRRKKEEGRGKRENDL
jgi:hypothetical protein